MAPYISWHYIFFYIYTFFFGRFLWAIFTVLCVWMVFPFPALCKTTYLEIHHHRRRPILLSISDTSLSPECRPCPTLTIIQPWLIWISLYFSQTLEVAYFKRNPLIFHFRQHEVYLKKHIRVLHTSPQILFWSCVTLKFISLRSPLFYLPVSKILRFCKNV
jgi:hypothetical protein